MLSTQNLAGYATFSYDYFLNGGIISCTCPDCKSKVEIPIRIYQSGIPVEKLEEHYGMQLIDELLERRIVDRKDENSRIHSNLKTYILWNMDARYEIVGCTGCNNEFLTVFGMAELQPGREEVQFKGIWKLQK